MGEKSIECCDKYKDKALRFIDKTTHYELIFCDDFNYPQSGGDSWSKPDTLITDIITDMRAANKRKELHLFIGSFGGYVAGLNMFLQQVLEFDYRVGINLGYACSCGFMLLASCQELYTSSFSEWMYHSMSSVAWGKVDEQRNKNIFDQKWWALLQNVTGATQLLTPEEIKLGETSEVWLTGADLIERGLAYPYELYNKRSMISPANDEFYIVDGQVFRREPNGSFSKYSKDKPCKKNNQNKFSYLTLIAMNSPHLQEFSAVIASHRDDSKTPSTEEGK